jgi:phosphohistidine phosphatase SixA
MAPEGDASRLVQRLVSEQRKRVLLVGHEPDLSGLVASLVGGFGRSFDKAMIVGLQVPQRGAGAHLRFVLDPRSLELETNLLPPP